MEKLILRVTILYTCIYFIYTYIMALFGQECFNDLYIILFEVTLCVVMSTQGRYHCRHMKYTAYGIVSSDTFTRIDSEYDLVSYDMAVLLPVSLVVLGISTTFFMALRHFYKVKQLKRRKDELHRGRTE